MTNYYRSYKRNTKPLWNCTVTEGILYVNGQDGKPIIKCRLSATGCCIRIEQLATRARRYFTNFDRAKRHVLYDQDINTTKYIGQKFDSWLKAVDKSKSSTNTVKTNDSTAKTKNDATKAKTKNSTTKTKSKPTKKESK